MNDSRTGNPVLVLAADEGFAMPLAVTVRSVLDTANPKRPLTFYILDGGISSATKQRLLKSWETPQPHRFEWVTVTAEAFAGIETVGHVNHMTYYRILIPRVLPEHVQRAIYLDADLIVRRDVCELWDLGTGDELCMAVQDPAAPFIDASQVLKNVERSGPYLAALRPILNFEALRLPPDQPYFNGGVLVMNVARWRQEDLPQQLIDCLYNNKEFVVWWDQYALNVVLCGLWTPIDMRWNQGSHIFLFPGWEESPLDASTFERLRNDPFIVHFTSPVKPWQLQCRHPYRQEWYRCLKKTDWRGWRPRGSDLVSTLSRAGYQLCRAGYHLCRAGYRRIRSYL